MPIEVNYPGVYVEELPSGQHTITPVATNIAAFVGRAPFGPTDEPTTIFSFGDFQRQYGGLQFDYPLSYAVQDFFANGGSQAIIARLFEPNDGDGVARLKFSGPSPHLVLNAANPGEWGNYLPASVDNVGISDATAKQFAEYHLTAADLFNLTLTRRDAHGQIIATERYLNLAVKSDGPSVNFPNRIDRAVKSMSNLARVDRLSAVPPNDGTDAQGIGGNIGTYLSTEAYLGNRNAKSGLYLLEKAALFSLLCIPPDRRILPDTPESEQDLEQLVRQAAASYCTDRRAFYIVDPPVA